MWQTKSSSGRTRYAIIYHFIKRTFEGKNREKTNLRNFRIHKNGRQEWAVVEEEGRLSAIPTEEE